MLVQEILLENTPDRYVLHHTAEIDADGNKIYRTYDTHTKRYVKTFSGPNAKIDALNWSVDNNAQYRQQEYKKKQDKEETDKDKNKKKEKIKASQQTFKDIMNSKAIKSIFKWAIALDLGDDLWTYSKRYLKAYHLNGCTDKVIMTNISPYTKRPIGKDIQYFKQKLEENLSEVAVATIQIIFAGTLFSISSALLAPFIAISIGTMGTFLIVAAVAVALSWVSGAIIEEIISRDELEKKLHQMLSGIFWKAFGDSLGDGCKMSGLSFYTFEESILYEQEQADVLLDRLIEKIPSRFRKYLQPLLNAKDSAEKILTTITKMVKALKY